MKTGAQRALWAAVAGLGLSGVLNTVLVVASGLGRWSLGNALPALAGLLLLGAGLRKLRDPRRPLVGNRQLRRSLMVLGAAGVLWAAVVLGLMLFGWQEPGEEPVAWILVPGAGLRGDQLSLTLMTRLDAALLLHRAHPEARVVVSGGQGPDELIPEAQAMAAYLAQHGVPPEQIFEERRSTSTLENMAFSKALMARAGWQPDAVVAVVTSRYHLYRAQSMARAQGLRAVSVPAEVPASVWAGSWLREILAVSRHLVVKAH